MNKRVRTSVERFVIDAAEWYLRNDPPGSELAMSARGWQELAITFAASRRVHKDGIRSTGFPAGGKSVSLRQMVSVMLRLHRKGKVTVDGRTNDYDVNVYRYVKPYKEGGSVAIVDDGPGDEPQPEIMWF